MPEFKYQVIETYGSLSESNKGWKKEIKLISWNQKVPKLRSCVRSAAVASHASDKAVNPYDILISHSDMAEHATMGIYSSTADKMYTGYIKPQDNGNRSEVRWAKVTNDEGNGL